MSSATIPYPPPPPLFPLFTFLFFVKAICKRVSSGSLLLLLL